jgi:hypothetical protein
MPARYFLFSAALFGSLLPTAKSSTDDAQQKSASIADHDLISSGSNVASSFLAAESEMELNKLIMNKRKAALRRKEELVAYDDNGKTVATSVDPDKLAALSSSISPDTYKQHLNDFVSSASGSRYIKNEGNTAAAEYLKTKLEGMGYEVHELAWEPSMKPPGTINNVGSIVGFKKGQDLGDEAILIGAHFDSVNWKDTSKAAPGVDDNGSGVAGVLSVADSLKDHSPRRNAVLAFFNAEEEGRFGSRSFVESVVNQKKLPELGSIKGALILDEVAFPGRDKYANQAIFETVGSVDGSDSLVDTLAHHVEDQSDRIGRFWVNWKGFGSDHISLLDAGIPAALLIERDDEWHADRYAHTAKDTFKTLSMEYGATMSRLALRTSTVLLNPKIQSVAALTDFQADGGAPDSPPSPQRFKTRLNPSALKFQEAQMKQKYRGHVDV